ncbi:EAL domain-containing protein [Idiomarina piscisalsi]|uniref:EAL domain-containing protein n=1 Tax=Idiomarina piscisalsi TaxID=1096243 RepID=UPI00350E33EE
MNLSVTEPLNILLIEDDADDYVLAKDLLLKGAPEYQLSWATNKEEALEAISEQDFDVILCDFHLVADDGESVISTLRENHIETPVIFLTGQGTDELSQKAIKLGAEDYLEKAEVTPLALKKSIYYTLERRRYQRELLDSQLTFEYLLEDSLQSVILVDHQRTILYANPAAEKLLLQANSELRGRKLPLEYNHTTGFSHEGTLNLPNGKQKRVRHYSIQTHWQNKPVRLVHFEDISHHVELEQKVAFFANHDSLTGLPNRTLLADRLQQSMTLCKRNDVELGVVFIGLDGFKAVNDTMGHKVGDRLLLVAAERLNDCLRPGDTLARMEGDEFVAVLPELNHQGDAALVAERLLQAMQEPFFIDETELHLSASAGIAVTENHDEDPLRLVQQADIAMYEAKRQGHGSYQWFNQELDNQVSKNLRIRNSLQSGIDNKEFELYYQPQFYLSNGEVTGIEALIRWNHPEMGMIPPNDFIEVAENTGQIVPLSRWILLRACNDFIALSAERESLTTVSVNISTIHILRSEFVDTVRDVINESGIKPPQLVLEITESVFMRHPELAINKLYELRDLGVKVALDDFGTGYSSLSYLKNLPVNLLKIDRSFVNDMVSNRHDAAIIEGIISMAHHLELEVLAEGVETTAQQEYLRRCHCDAVQGFLLAKPMPKDALYDFLKDYQQSMVESQEDKGKQCVLIVDDEENVLKSLNRLLRRDGYKIYTAGSADEAFEVLAHHSVDVVISDQRMRNMQGLEFLSHVRAMYPGTARIVLTAYRNEESLTQAINDSEVYRFLDKPWDDEELRKTVRSSLRPRQESNLRPIA